MKIREEIKSKNRIVIKVGTSSLTYPNGKINFKRIERLVNVLSDLRNSGKEVILVSSGAIAVGTIRLGLTKRPDNLAGKQAAAAVGQAELIKIYQMFFDRYNQHVAQILITKDGMEHPVRKMHAQNTLFKLLEMGIIPIINENDTIATEEIEYGDNDTLSADVAVLIDADLLVILSDIDGLFSADPKKDREAQIISTVYEISDSIRNLASGAGSDFAKGGMITKIKAATICSDAGIDTIVANGENPNVIYRVLDGENIGTYFKTNKTIEDCIAVH